MTSKHHSGFSLVEMAVVISIIGLLIGGVAAGTHLYNTAQLNSAVAEHEYYAAATRNFIDKYNAYPGDMANATRYFGRMPEDADGNPLDAFGIAFCLQGYPEDNPAPTGYGTCNGGGDRRIGRTTMDDSYNSTQKLIQRGIEIINWPQHLAEGGMIEGDFGGMIEFISLLKLKGDVIMPRAKLNNALWACIYTDDAEILFLNDKEQHYMHLLGDNTDIVSDPMDWQPPLTPSEASSIDLKIDDGKPALGKVITFVGSSSATNPITSNPVGDVLTNCTITPGGDVTDIGDTDALYNQAYEDKACTLSFVLGF